MFQFWPLLWLASDFVVYNQLYIIIMIRQIMIWSDWKNIDSCQQQHVTYQSHWESLIKSIATIMQSNKGLNSDQAL